MKFVSEVYWDKGERGVNQDSVSLQQVSIRGKRAVFALVCDGIGGLQQGEEASGFVAERMTEWFYTEAVGMLRKKKSRKKIGRAGLRALYGCNGELEAYGKRRGIKTGTAMTMLLISKERYLVWHSGDTRLYRVDSGRGRQIKIKQLTKDHTADNHTLIRCIGSFPWKEPDVSGGRLKRNCVLLLCTDGFRNRVPEEKIGEVLQPAFLISQEQMGKRLRELAGYGKRNGETDNISAIAMKSSGK